MTSPRTRTAAGPLTETQVDASFRTLGLAPVAPTAHIAAAVGAQLQATAMAFEQLSWGAEPTEFRRRLAQHASPSFRDVAKAP